MPKLKVLKPKSIETTLLNRIRLGSVAERYPSVTNEWNSKNYFGPDLFGASSGELIVWTCAQGHAYRCSVAQRTRVLQKQKKEAAPSKLKERLQPKSDCPICAGRIPAYKDSLEARHPGIAAEWHEFRNRTRHPREIFDESSLLAYWRCRRCGHTYRMCVNSRISQSAPQGCPNCTDDPRVNLYLVPQASVEFTLSDLNFGIDPELLPENYQVFWNCKCGGHLIYESFSHLCEREWQCSVCLSKQNTKYLSDYPELCLQLVTVDGNTVDPQTVPAGSHKLATWQCDRGADHTWTTPVYSRVLDRSDCPFCANRMASATNSLANFPALSNEFHPFKNGLLTPDKVVASARLLLWWLCAYCAHEWERYVYLRTQRGSRCPRCKGKPERARRLIIEDLISASVTSGRERKR
jgi:Probable Zinc-ribbon domain